MILSALLWFQTDSPFSFDCLMVYLWFESVADRILIFESIVTVWVAEAYVAALAVLPAAEVLCFAWFIFTPSFDLNILCSSMPYSLMVMAFLILAPNRLSIRWNHVLVRLLRLLSVKQCVYA